MTRKSLVEQTSPERKESPDFDKKAVGKLYGMLKSRGKIRSAKLSTWVKYFRLLRSDGKTENQIIGALEWFQLHIDDEYVPIITNGKQFREKFPSLERMMAKDIDTVMISDEALHLVDVLENKNWPGESSIHLGVVVQRSLTNYRVFKKKLVDLYDALEVSKARQSLQDKMIHRFLTNLLELVFITPHHFVLVWMKEVHRMINWSGWSGSLLNMEFKEDSKILERLGREWAMSYCCLPRRWDMLMKELKREM